MQIRKTVEPNEYGLWKIKTHNGTVFGRCISANNNSIVMEDFRHPSRGNVTVKKKDIISIEFSDRVNKKLERIGVSEKNDTAEISH